MKSVMHRAYLNPIVRVVVFFVVLGVCAALWDSPSREDWGATKAFVSTLPAPLAANLSVSTRDDVAAGCADDGKLYLTGLSAGAGTPSAPRNVPLPAGALCASGVWSPDGSRLLMPYVTTTADRAAAGLVLISVKGRPTARILRLHGGLDPAIPPAWSPDGRQIAYVAGIRTKSMGGLWLIDLGTRIVKRLRLGEIYSPAFSPSGDRVLFEEDTALASRKFDETIGDWLHVWTLGSVSIAGDQPKRLAEWTQGTMMPISTVLVAPRPDGARYLRYYQAKGRGPRLEVWEGFENRPSEKKMTIALDFGHLDRDLKWSSDGGRFAYLDYISDGGPSTIRLADVDAGTLRTVAPGHGTPDTAPAAGEVVGRSWSQPALSADGRWIAATLASVVTGPPPGQETDDDEPSTDHPVHISVDTQKPVLLRIP